MHCPSATTVVSRTMSTGDGTAVVRLGDSMRLEEEGEAGGDKQCNLCCDLSRLAAHKNINKYVDNTKETTV